ncbi:hypothetical protein F4779DRAFT_559211 [Xylariaceae sp. FL0662B]|nr:hypothetical protein F4779DRAFT_559211 [Xylariaceae sp. FL0662B]
MNSKFFGRTGPSDRLDGLLQQTQIEPTRPVRLYIGRSCGLLLLLASWGLGFLPPSAHGYGSGDDIPTYLPICLFICLSIYLSTYVGYFQSLHTYLSAARSSLSLSYTQCAA